MSRISSCRVIWWRFEGMESGTRAGIGRSLKFKPQPNKRHSMPIEFASAGSCLAPLPEASTAPC